MNEHPSERKHMRRIITIICAAMLICTCFGIALNSNTASATEGDEPCVPQEAWTEVVEHPAVTHEETVTVVDEEAWTETIPAVPGQWWNFAPNNNRDPFVGPPAFPVDERGTWVGPHTEGGPDGEGTYAVGNPDKGGNWFHREAGTPEQTIEHPAVTHEETTTVVDEEAWTETIEHEAVTCDDEEPPTECPALVFRDGDQADDDCSQPEPPPIKDEPKDEPKDDKPKGPFSLEQSCTPTRCVTITRDRHGDVVGKPKVVKYDADVREEGL